MNRLLVILLIAPLPLWGADLRFQYKAGDQLNYVGQSQQTVLLNGKVLQSNNNMSRSQYEVAEEGQQTMLRVSTVIDTDSKGAHSAGQDSQSKQIEYSIAPDGTYTVPQNASLPIVRDIPTFPSESLVEGQTWSKPGKEVLDLSGIAIFSQNKKQLPPIPISFPVSYRYRGGSLQKDRTLDSIDVEYDIAYRPTFNRADFRVAPVLVSGRTTETILFDNLLGLEESQTEQYVLDLVLSNGDIYEFSGTSNTQLSPSVLQPRPTPLPAMTQTVAPQGQSGDQDTATLPPDMQLTRKKPSFDPIWFAPNTADLLPEEQKKLDAVAATLKDHLGDILVEGFAADAGSATQQKSLSEARAEAVAAYLVSLGVRSTDQIVTSGQGARRPLAANDTQENRAKNRRAVILLLDQ